MLREGFLHRDISIGNILMLDPPVTMNSFKVRAVGQLMTRFSLQYEGEFAKYANLLEDAIKKMDYLDKCHGFLIDGDMAAKLEGYFTVCDTGEVFVSICLVARGIQLMTFVQGTYEFMSGRLASTLRTANPYLHSPVDDLESFYYTAQWAAAFNDGASGRRHDGIGIQHFRELIVGNQKDRAAIMVRDELFPRSAGMTYGPFFAQSLYLLTPWREKLAILIRDWIQLTETTVGHNEDKDEFLGLDFLIYGYRGVAEYLELVHEHRASLQGAV